MNGIWKNKQLYRRNKKFADFNFNKAESILGDRNYDTPKQESAYSQLLATIV